MLPRMLPRDVVHVLAQRTLRGLSVMVQLAPELEAMSFIERYLGSMQFRTSYLTRLTPRMRPLRFTVKRMEPEVLTMRARRSARYVSR
jgi:hypothetical protein